MNIFILYTEMIITVPPNCQGVDPNNALFDWGRVRVVYAEKPRNMHILDSDFPCLESVAEFLIVTLKKNM